MLALALAGAILSVDGVTPVPLDFSAPVTNEYVTVQSAIDPAVRDVLQAHQDEIHRLNFKLAKMERIADSTAECVKSAFIWAGSDVAVQARRRSGARTAPSKTLLDSTT